MISSPPATRSILYLDCRHLTVCILGAEKTAVGVFCPDEGLARARARCSGLSRSGLAHPGASPRSLILYSCAPRVDRLYYHTARFWSLHETSPRLQVWTAPKPSTTTPASKSAAVEGGKGSLRELIKSRRHQTVLRQSQTSVSIKVSCL
jgi:hypothetical protein